MKKFLLIACALVAAIWAVSLPLACGPQKKFCPNTKTGDCPEDMGGNGGGGAGGDDGGSVFLET